MKMLRYVMNAMDNDSIVA